MKIFPHSERECLMPVEFLANNRIRIEEEVVFFFSFFIARFVLCSSFSSAFLKFGLENSHLKVAAPPLCSKHNMKHQSFFLTLNFATPLP